MAKSIASSARSCEARTHQKEKRKREKGKRKREKGKGKGCAARGALPDARGSPPFPFHFYLRAARDASVRRWRHCRGAASSRAETVEPFRRRGVPGPGIEDAPIDARGLGGRFRLLEDVCRPLQGRNLIWRRVGGDAPGKGDRGVALAAAKKALGEQALQGQGAGLAGDR